MNPPPRGWPRISSAIFYENPRAAIDWICRAFGFDVKLKVEGEDGSIRHSELAIDGGLIMVGGLDARYPHRRTPKSIDGGNTQSVMVFVDDADAHCAHARSCGAKILMEPETHDHGAEYWSDRSYEAEDLEGHRWWFTQRVRTAGE